MAFKIDPKEVEAQARGAGLAVRRILHYLDVYSPNDPRHSMKINTKDGTATVPTDFGFFKVAVQDAGVLAEIINAFRMASDASKRDEVTSILNKYVIKSSADAGVEEPDGALAVKGEGKRVSNYNQACVGRCMRNKKSKGWDLKDEEEREQAVAICINECKTEKSTGATCNCTGCTVSKTQDFNTRTADAYKKAVEKMLPFWYTALSLALRKYNKSPEE